MKLGLTGEIRPVNQVDKRISEAARLGFEMLVPFGNKSNSMAGFDGIEVSYVATVEEALGHLF